MTEPFGQPLNSKGQVSISHVTERFGQGREHMKFVSLLSFALAMGLSVATWTSPASAAVKDSTAAREAAMTKCNAEAHSHYPGGYRDWDTSRDLAYQRCMLDAGHMR
jgi:hypothetical protein